MKRLIVALLSFIALSFTSFHLKNSLNELNLLGKVKSISTTEFDVITDSLGTILKEKKKAPTIESNFIKFNADGNKTLEVWYNEENAFDIKDSMIYDTLKILVEVKRIKSNGTKYKTAYFYNAKGQKTEMIKYRSTGIVFSKRIFFYDAKNNLKEQKEFDDKEKQTEHLTFKCDALNRILEESTNSPNGTIIEHSYKYDAKGNTIEKRWYEPDGKPGEEMLIKYDDKNNTIEIDNYDSHGTLLEKYKYKYTFDSSNNWINCVISKDDKPLTIKERKIEYFP